MIEYEKRMGNIKFKFRSDNNFLINLLKNLSNAKTVVSMTFHLYSLCYVYKQKVFLVEKIKIIKQHICK